MGNRIILFMVITTALMLIFKEPLVEFLNYLLELSFQNTRII